MVVGGVTRGTRRRVGRKCCGRVGLRQRCTSALELTPPASSWAPLHFVYAHLNYSNSTHITSNTVQGMRYHTHTHTSATLPGLCHSPNTPQISHSLSPGDRTHHADTHDALPRAAFELLGGKCTVASLIDQSTKLSCSRAVNQRRTACPWSSGGPRGRITQRGVAGRCQCRD